MPRIRIPQTGTLIEWPPAAAGRVRVHGTLHLGEPNQAGCRVELSFKRDPFRRLFKQSEFWAYVRHALCKLGDKWPPTPEDLRTHLTKKELSVVRQVLPTYDPSQLTTGGRREWAAGAEHTANAAGIEKAHSWADRLHAVQ